jgi:hypothetical protein
VHGRTIVWFAVGIKGHRCTLPQEHSSQFFVMAAEPANQASFQFSLVPAQNPSKTTPLLT